MVPAEGRNAALHMAERGRAKSVQEGTKLHTYPCEPSWPKNLERTLL
jgi:hypothetical protein